MTTGLMQRLESVLLHLPTSERARLARILIESLDEEAEVEEAWAQEVRKRLDEIDSGEAELLPAEEVIAELRARTEG